MLAIGGPPLRVARSLKYLGSSDGPRIGERRTRMNDQSRVLIRQGARDLTQKEVEQINGGSIVHTNVITWGPNGRDGDGLLGEC